MGYSIKDQEKAGRTINEHFERNVYFLYYRKIMIILQGSEPAPWQFSS